MSYSDFVPHYDNFPHTLFEKVARDCTNDDILVEVGAFLGHGTCYMAECLTAYDKRPKFYALDPFDQILEPIYGQMRTGDMPWGESIEKWRARGGRLYDSFLFYLDNCPCKDRLYDHAQFPCNSSAGEFEDGTLAFVFLNYARDFDGIKEEMENWWPKIKNGGCLAMGGNLVEIEKVALDFMDRHDNGTSDLLLIAASDETHWKMIKPSSTAV